MRDYLVTVTILPATYHPSVLYVLPTAATDHN